MTLHLRDGTSLELPVRDNVFAGRVDADAARGMPGVEWSGMQRP